MNQKGLRSVVRKDKLERERGFEPPTLALARRCSTTELFPLSQEDAIDSSGHPIACQAMVV